jgi:hypothetical protein
MRYFRPLCRIALLMALFAATAHAEIGTVTFKAGDVSIQLPSGAFRAATKGTAVNEGDTIIVGPLSTAQLKMIDGGILALRPDTKMKFDAYVWSGKEDGSERGLMSLIEGRFRTITGAIGRLNKTNYKVTTATATVGIRGTDHEVAFVPAPPPGAVPLPPDAPAPGTYDKVNVGAATITSQGVTLVVQSNQVGFAPPAAAPQILPVVPSFMRATAPPRPAPAQQQAQQGGQQQAAAEQPAAPRSTSVVDSDSQVASASSVAVQAADTQPVAVATVVEVTPLEATAATTTVAETTTVPLVLTSTSGQTVNASEQVLTSSSGTTTSLASGTTAAVVKTNPTVQTSYYYWNSTLKSFGTGDVFRTEDFEGFDASFSFAGPNNNFLSATKTGNESREMTLSGDLSGASTVTTLANGISFGRYASGSTATNPSGSALLVMGRDFDGSFTNREVLGSFHWIYGPEISQVFTTAIRRGTASYSVAGHSPPTDQNNMTGTLNSAALSVNFDKQSVSAGLSVTMPANTANGGTQTRAWSAGVSNVILDDGGGFHAGSTSSNYAHNNVSVFLNSTTQNSFGSISGQLTGSGLDGAALSYTLAGNDPLNGSKHEHVNGVIAFNSPSFSSTATVPFYTKLTARGSIAGLDASTGQVSPSNPAWKISDEYLTLTRITQLDADRTTIVNGELVEFDGRSVIVSVNPNVNAIAPYSCGVNAQCFTSDLPSRIGIVAAGSGATGALPAMPSITGAATVADAGSDPATGIIWGRYTNGNFALVNRITGSPVGTGNTNLGHIHHYLLSGAQTSPTVLPTTGSYSYTFAGGTNPTDTTGAIGTLNSATLFANFLSRTVNVAVDATVGGRNWTASASNVNIIAGLGFEVAKRIDGTGSLAVSCTGCVSTGTSGQITGAFTGATGEGAGIAYSLNSGGIPGGNGVTVGGVAAFRR